MRKEHKSNEAFLLVEKGREDSLGERGREERECQVPSPDPDSSPNGILRLGKASLGPVSWRFLVGRRRRGLESTGCHYRRKDRTTDLATWSESSA